MPRRPVLPLAVTVLLMWALGALLGLVWQWWSPAGPAGYVIAPGLIQPDETEAFVAADGRFAVITLGVGVLAGLLVWITGVGRGMPAVFTLVLGGLGGATALALVGHATRAVGQHYACGTGASCITHLPLAVHAHGLIFVEAAGAVLVYGLCVSFARADDLGVPDRMRELVGSVGADVELEHAGRHRDGPGGPQQGGLAP